VLCVVCVVCVVCVCVVTVHVNSCGKRRKAKMVSM
jgi:hypothetical protein